MKMNRNDAPALIERPLRYIRKNGHFWEFRDAELFAKQGDGRTVQGMARVVYNRLHAKIATKKGIFK